MTGEKVVPTERVEASVDMADTPSRPQRKRPKVIDARQRPEDAEGQSWAMDGPIDGPAHEGKAWDPDAPGEAGEGASWDPDAPGKAGDAASWDNEDAKNPQADAYVPDVKPEAVIVSEPVVASEPAPVQPAPELIAEPIPEPPPPPKPKALPKLEPVKAAINPASAKAQGEVLAQAAVSSMVDKMRAEAARKGSLSVADIDAMQGEMNEQAVALTATFEKRLEEFAIARDRANWDEKRDYPFDRLIVKRFSALFQETDLSRFDRVSRRILPGFFMALNMILGPEAVEDLQARCRIVVDRVRMERGEVFDWEDVYAAKDARTLVLDALIVIAQQFDNFERRTEWFIELINGHLTPAEDAPKDDAGWELSPAGVKTFLNALLGDLRRVLSTDQGKRHISKRHGADAVAAAERVFRIIDS